MKLIGRLRLEEFKKKHAEVASQIDSWVAEVIEARWETPIDVKKRYSSASFLKDNHVIFNLKGNKFRLRVQIHYKQMIVLIEDIGTHQQYMKW